MKKLLALAALTLSSPAFAASVSVDCATPREMAGGVRVRLGGELHLETLPTGQRKATGSLELSLRQNRKVVFDGEVAVTGVYDDLEHEYASLGSADEGFEDSTFYVNFDDPTLSFVEHLGESYPLDCTRP